MRIRYSMKLNHQFILGASNEIDRRALQYLLNPPKLWEPEPPQIDRSHITVYFPKDSASSRLALQTQQYLKEEKISWIVAGEDAEALDEILLEKSDYLISGIEADDSIRGHFSNISEGRKQPEQQKVDISLTRLLYRQQGYSLREGSGQRLRGKRWPDCRMCGKRHKRRDICPEGGEKNNANDSWNPRVAYPERDDLRWEELKAEDMIRSYWSEKHDNILVAFQDSCWSG